MVSLGLLLCCVAVRLSGAVPVYITPDSHLPCTYTALTDAVKILDCSGRGLTEVPLVDPAMTVSAFYLDGNAIVSIGPKAFANLTRSLTLLSVKSTAMMDRIDSSAFADLTALATLTVHGKERSDDTMNKVNIGQLLSGLRSLSSLSMVDINIKELPTGFAGGTILTDLSMIRTAIVTISPHAFTNASKLRTLDLSENRFGATGSMNWLSAAISLETGVFANCGITKEYLGQMPSLPKLKKLVLNKNDLTRLESNSLSNVATNLAELVLSNNPISEANTVGIAGMLALKKLTMTDNSQLSAIPPEVKQLQALELLDLRGTKVAGVKGDSFHTRSQLRILKLDYTNVQSLHALAFSTVSTSLEEFTLSATNLGTAIIQNMAGVQQPGNWTVILEQVRSLQVLSLSGTEAGEENSGGLTNSIWSAVQQLPRLRRLTLDYNKITVVPDFYLSGFANLSYVSLAGNTISRVTSGTFYGTGGAQIRLHSNNLVAIDNCTLAMFRNLSAVSLGGNPLTCNCAMQWLWKRVKAESPVSLTSMSCSQPAALAGRTWDTLVESNFCSSGEIPPNNCSVLAPSTEQPPTTPSFPHLLNITVSKASESSVNLEASVGKLVRQFTSYTVKYWPVSRPEAVLNVSRLPLTTSVITLQIKANEKYRFCYALINGSAASLESPGNCREYTLSSLASGAMIAIAVLASIIGIALVFAVVCVLCKRLRRGQAGHQTVEEDPYIYTYPDDKQIGKSKGRSSNNNSSQFQATLRPESKRYSKRSRNNLAGSRPSLATSTTTIATCRTSSPAGFALQNGARPVSGGVLTQHQQQPPPLPLSGAGGVQPSRSMHSIADTGADRFGVRDPRFRQQDNQLMSRSQDQLSEAPAAALTSHRSARMLPPPPPRHAHSQELVLDVMRAPGTAATAAGSARYLHQQPPSLPPARGRIPPQSYQTQQQQQLDQLQGQGGPSSDGGYMPMASAYLADAAAAGESSTDDNTRQQPRSAEHAYNPYLPDDQQLDATPPPPPPPPPQPVVRVISGNGGVVNSGFQRNDTSGYYEMGQF